MLDLYVRLLKRDNKYMDLYDSIFNFIVRFGGR